MDQLRECSPEELSAVTFPFEDARLPEMLFRYRARNYPETLTEDEQALWEEYRFARLTDPEAGGGICMEAYQEMIESLVESGELSLPQCELMEQLLEYSDSLLS